LRSSKELEIQFRGKAVKRETSSSSRGTPVTEFHRHDNS